MKARKKPVVIDAELFRKDHQPWPSCIFEPPCPCAVEADSFWIETLEGHHHVSDGDWIITGVAGEKYPCKPDIFIKTYEPVLEEDEA